MRAHSEVRSKQVAFELRETVNCFLSLSLSLSHTHTHTLTNTHTHRNKQTYTHSLLPYVTKCFLWRQRNSRVGTDELQRRERERESKRKREREREREREKEQICVRAFVRACVRSCVLAFPSTVRNGNWGQDDFCILVLFLPLLLGEFPSLKL